MTEHDRSRTTGAAGAAFLLGLGVALAACAGSGVAPAAGCDGGTRGPTVQLSEFKFDPRSGTKSPV